MVPPVPSSASDVGAAEATGWDRRRERVRRDLETVAIGLFAARGFDAVSYDDIAGAAGTSMRTLYRYFGSKDEFLLGHARWMTDGIAGVIADITPTGRPIRDFVDTLIAVSEANAHKNADVVVWHRALSTAPEVAARVRGEQARVIEDAVSAYCARALDAPRDAVSVRVTASTIAALVDTVTRVWLNSGGRRDTATLYREALAGLQAGMREAPARGR
jgi:AcrR family transcriptional regulator